jgi:hypothetical protein
MTSYVFPQKSNEKKKQTNKQAHVFFQVRLALYEHVYVGGHIQSEAAFIARLTSISSFIP